MAEFHFLRPWWLLGLVPLMVLCWQLRRTQVASRLWQSHMDGPLMQALLLGGGGQRRHTVWWVALAGVLMVFALAGPAWQRLPQPVMKLEQPRVFVLDLSRSMLATDIAPSRLVRARLKLLDALAMAGEGRNGLVVFAGAPFVVSPLTDDAKTISAQVSVLHPQLVPTSGSDVAAAIDKAVELLQQAGARRGQVILIGDDSGGEAARAAAIRAVSAGHAVSVLATGTAEGAPIPLDKGGFVKDSEGSIVVPRLDVAALAELAAAGEGVFQVMQNDDADIQRLVKVDRLDRSWREDENERQLDLWRDEGPWLLLPLLPLVMLAFRRGWLFSLVLLPSLLPPPSLAAETSPWWRNNDQRAATLMEQEQWQEAAERFADPAWRASAWYRAGDWAKAAEAYAGLEGADAAYNRGNALARGGYLEGALKAYDDALTQAPGMEDARFNRDLVARLLQQQQEQQQQSGEEGQPGQPQQGDTAQQGGQQDSPQGTTEAQQSSAGDGEDGGQDTAGAQATEQKGDQGDSPAQAQDADEADEQAESRMASGDGDQRGEPEAAQVLEGDAGEDEESVQAMAQWLRRIPDDPGGLLRRKFMIQHRQSGASRQEGEKTW